MLVSALTVFALLPLSLAFPVAPVVDRAEPGIALAVDERTPAIASLAAPGSVNAFGRAIASVASSDESLAFGALPRAAVPAAANDAVSIDAFGRRDALPTAVITDTASLDAFGK
ncbi:hypothetical protein L202_02323 [Cryptococcus amylolentus CBS 6039]|uniref:Uncharacterized protein n=2 Tax=Cryptococcus amylolentus TaxID=104669 RepID=A0A1E3I0Y5_9TREE|nr:hypothetical protein L202_02323 [Cryptococcus amylolentus CBS 6039]ODN81995.1 hypothetical protein L202_02323 [Cryptococcus amylolentus CBS 6039]ODO09872.1 hypothetical protein I350_02094 [Cryptococcus amylolentus CBS 6273]